MYSRTATKTAGGVIGVHAAELIAWCYARRAWHNIDTGWRRDVPRPQSLSGDPQGCCETRRASEKI
jgi:hypothetical protein